MWAPLEPCGVKPVKEMEEGVCEKDVTGISRFFLWSPKLQGEDSVKPEQVVLVLF